MATVQTLKDLGEQMGLKGTELSDFIKQQDFEREERNRLREEQDKQRAEQDRQRESEKEQREHDKIQHDKKEQREREKEQHEIERLKFERDKMDFALQMKVTEVKKASIVKSENEEGEDNKEGSVASSHTRQRIGAKGPRMPCFDKRSDDMDSFLHRFEVICR